MSTNDSTMTVPLTAGQPETASELTMPGKRHKRGPENRNPGTTGPGPAEAQARDQWHRALAAKQERERAGEFRKNLAATGGYGIKTGSPGAVALHRDSLDLDIPEPLNRRARRIIARYGNGS